LALAAALSAQTATTKPAPPTAKSMEPMVTDATKAATEKALLANEQKILDAVQKGDLAGFKVLVMADGWSVDGGGFMSVADFEKNFSQVKVTEQHMSESKVLWVDANTAIVGYTWTGQGSFMGQAFPSPTYATTVWNKRGTTWVAVCHQEVPAGK
jgi:hypothetical protein